MFSNGVCVYFLCELFHCCFFFFFFFQAEDGIRDVAVTGVQTCALPIWIRSHRGRAGGRGRPARVGGGRSPSRDLRAQGFASTRSSRGSGKLTCSSRRSEERRVGKECRCGWGAWCWRKKIW